MAGLPYPLALFSLETVAACTAGGITSMDGGGFDVTTERLATAVRAHLHCTGLGGGKADVDVTVTLPDDSPLASWTIAVDAVSPALALRSQSAPAVVAGALRSDAGNPAVALANIDAVPHTVSVALPGTERQLPFLVWAVVDDVYQVLYQGASPPPTIEVALPPRTPALVALVSQRGLKPSSGPRARRGARH